MAGQTTTFDCSFSLLSASSCRAPHLSKDSGTRSSFVVTVFMLHRGNAASCARIPHLGQGMSSVASRARSFGTDAIIERALSLEGGNARGVACRLAQARL